MSSATPPWPPAPFTDSGSGLDAYRARRSDTPDPPEVAMPTAIRMIASAATPAMTSAIVSTGQYSLPCLVGEPEETGREIDSHDLELFDELRPDPCRLEPALDLAFDDAGLLEHEDVLHDDDIAFHPLDFGDVHDLAGPVLETRLLDDEVDRRGDLLADGPQGQVDAGHEDHRLETRQHVTWGVGVARRHRAVVARVHRLEHVERLAGPALPDDDAIGSHAEGVADEL